MADTVCRLLQINEDSTQPEYVEYVKFIEILENWHIFTCVNSLFYAMMRKKLVDITLQPVWFCMAAFAEYT